MVPARCSVSEALNKLPYRRDKNENIRLKEKELIAEYNEHDHYDQVNKAYRFIVIAAQSG